MSGNFSILDAILPGLQINFQIFKNLLKLI